MTYASLLRMPFTDVVAERNRLRHYLTKTDEQCADLRAVERRIAEHPVREGCPIEEMGLILNFFEVKLTCLQKSAVSQTWLARVAPVGDLGIEDSDVWFENTHWDVHEALNSVLRMAAKWRVDQGFRRMRDILDPPRTSG